MLRLEVTHGSAFAKLLESFNDDGSVPTTFLATDTLRCDFWNGQDQTVLFNPTVSWADATIGTVNYGITNSQCALTEPNGIYHVQVFAARNGTEVCLADFLQAITPSVGISTQATLCYCSYNNILDIAPWITSVQDVDVDVEGFYSQRLKARLWLDDIIVNRFQNNYVGLYGAHSQAAFDALGNQNTIGPSPIIINALAANQLILRPAIVEVCSHYAVGLIGIAQVITGNQNLMKMGQYHIAKALREVSGITAEIDTNADGLADMLANLSTVNTIFG